MCMFVGLSLDSESAIAAAYVEAIFDRVKIFGEKKIAFTRARQAPSTNRKSPTSGHFREAVTPLSELSSSTCF